MALRLPLPRPSLRHALIGAPVAIVLALIVVWWRLGEAYYFRMLAESPRQGVCETRLNASVIDRSIALSRDYLRAQQTRAGNFHYEYDWRSGEDLEGDNETRQAGALWGLSIAHQHEPSSALQRAVERGLAFFDKQSRERDGRRCTAYAGSRTGSTGTVALVALAHIEYQRTMGAKLSEDERQKQDVFLDGYLAQLTESQLENGLFHSQFKGRSCAPVGPASPYADGEALLALAKAYKYLGREKLLAPLVRAANAGYQLNVNEELAVNTDSPVTRGFYQWGTMAFYELSESDVPSPHRYADAIIDLADWMVDERGILYRNRNTGYAYEGLTLAYAVAKARGDEVRRAKYGCVIDIGLERLMTWQVGGPLANGYAGAEGSNDRRARGGVQNAARSALLRIDVTQHQLHALQMAREHVYTK